MKREIVQHGSSSLTVTLPSKWVRKFSLKKGDEVNIEETGNGILVSTDAVFSTAKKDVTVTEFGIFTKNNLSHLYQLGYDEITITFDSNDTLQEIKARLPECLGFEIIDQKENKIYVKSIAAALESEFDTLLRKAFLITNEMAKTIVQYVESMQFDKLKEIREMESLNNKFTDICIRILNKKGYKVQNRTTQVHEVIKNLERVCDELKHVCDLLGYQTKKTDKEIIASMKEAVNYYLSFYALFYKFDPDLKKKVYTERKKLLVRFKEQMRKSKGDETILMHHLLGIVEKTYDMAGAYFALIL